MKKAHIQTFGCQMNEHDSQRMADVLTQKGYLVSERREGCDLIILNTCSVRENPENKVYSQLGRIRELKRENENLVIGVGGCVAQQEGENILKREKSVDFVFGTDHFMHLPEMLDSVEKGKRVLNVGWMPRNKNVRNFIPEEELETRRVEGCRAFIAITKGCNNFCTFCIVPYTRGREVSREADNILAEAENLVSKGIREITLLGQNVNSYRAGNDDFYALLEKISAVPELLRLRFTSPHPKDWNDRLSDLMEANPVICNQLHLPFQSGSSRIVGLMRRGHTTEQYLKKIDYLKSKVPDVALSTDLIVGFPSETEEDFERTLEVVKYVRFHQIYAFKYSQRPGTRAAKMEDTVPRRVKEERLARLLAVHETIHGEIMDRYRNATSKVLVENYHPRLHNAVQGRTESNVPVAVRDGAAKVGSLIAVKIDKVNKYSLEATSLAQD